MSSFFRCDTLLPKSKHTKTFVGSCSYNPHMLGSTMVSFFIIPQMVMSEWGLDNEDKCHELRRASLYFAKEKGD